MATAARIVAAVTASVSCVDVAARAPTHTAETDIIFCGGIAVVATGPVRNR